MGDQFSVQLENLDDLSRKHLPKMAECLNEVLGHLGRTMDEARGAFLSAGGTGELFWSVNAGWEPTADFLQQVLQDNVENLGLAAKAIGEIAHRYRQADGQA